LIVTNDNRRKKRKKEEQEEDMPQVTAPSQGNHCTHEKYSIVDTAPSADGIEDVRIFHVKCDSCAKVLLERHECISLMYGAAHYVNDREWFERNPRFDNEELYFN